MDELMPLLRDNQRNPKVIKARFKAICKDLFDPKQPGVGTYNKKFASSWGGLFKSAFGEDGSKLVTM